MVKSKSIRIGKTNLVKELDAAIALLERVRAHAIATAAVNGVSGKPTKQVIKSKQPKRVLSATAREAIAAGQKKRWAKVRRQKRLAERSAKA